MHNRKIISLAIAGIMAVYVIGKTRQSPASLRNVAPPNVLDAEPDAALLEYRRYILAAEQRAQEDFDKTVLSLSGGALGISFAFVDKFIAGKPVVFAWELVLAWVAWAVSMSCVLVSFYMSQQALRHTLVQIDSGRIYSEPPGGRFDGMTRFLNPAGMVLFFVGVGFMVVFVSNNLR
jgi:hypothetical protein